MIETNVRPIFWLSNSIRHLDAAFSRRFDFILEVPVPKWGGPYQEAGAPELWLRHHADGRIEPVEIVQPNEAGYAGHGGGDWGLVNAMQRLFQGPNALPPGLDGIAGHRLAYLSEEARVSRQVVTA